MHFLCGGFMHIQRLAVHWRSALPPLAALTQPPDLDRYRALKICCLVYVRVPITIELTGLQARTCRKGPGWQACMNGARPQRGPGQLV